LPQRAVISAGLSSRSLPEHRLQASERRRRLVALV
jgi:hypothetical protein